MATGESLRRELNLLSSLRHPTLLLDVSGCRSIDADGVLLLVDTDRRMHEQGRRLAIIADAASTACIFEAPGGEGILPVFPTQAAAELALRGVGSISDHRPLTAIRTDC